MRLSHLIACVSSLLLVACGGGGGGGQGNPPVAQQFAIAVAVSGLAAGEQFTVELNQAVQIVVQQNGSAIFSSSLDDGATYAVLIVAQPNTQTCTLTNESGTINGANITNIQVTCAGFSVGGDVAGLNAGDVVELDLNGTQQLFVTANGVFQFADTLPDQSTFAVTITSTPSSKACTVLDGDGTIVNADVTNVSIICGSYFVGGTIRGLSPNESITLELNGTEEVFTDNGIYEFSQELPIDVDYFVSVLAGPAKKVCELENGSGTYPGSDVDDVNATCRLPFAVATLVQDFNSNVAVSSGDPSNIATFGQRIFVTAQQPGVGQEPVVVDSVSGLVTPLGDILPGVQSSLSSEFVDSGAGWGVFRANNGQVGDELWVTDGTADGTDLLVDINPGADGSTPRNFYVFGGLVYFVASDGVNGREIWHTDGTAAGTALLRDINPTGDGARSGGANFFADMGGELYFIASTGSARYQVWATDGTSVGTRAVTNVQDISLAVNQGPYFLEPFAGEMHFLWGDALFATTGASTDSREVVNTGQGLFGLTAIGAELYIGASTGPELWISDGSTTNTIGFDIDIFGFGPANFVAFNGEVAFRAGGELWTTDGTAPGTRSIVDGVEGNGFLHLGDELLFVRDTPAEGREAWAYDGSSAYLVQDLVPGDDSGLVVLQGVVVGGSAYFNAERLDVGRELFTTDDGISGLSLAANLWPDTATQIGVSQIAGRIDEQLFLSARQDANWDVVRYDTINATFTAITDFQRRTESFEMFVLADRFWLTDSNEDGLFTATSTAQTLQIVPNVPAPRDLISEYQGRLVYSGFDAVTFDRRLVLTDGTETGTSIIQGIVSPGAFGSFGDLGLFSGSQEGVFDPELWVLDGTQPTFVADLSPNNNGQPQKFVDLGSVAVFNAFDDSRFAPFATDGTTAGTVALLDPLNTGSVFDNVQFGDRVIFALEAAPNTYLWQTDGTVVGTTQLFENMPELRVGFPREFKEVNGRFYFSAQTDQNGVEPWVLDDIDSDPRLLIDAQAGPESSFPATFSPLAEYAVFKAYDDVSGRWQLWFTNGTPECVSLVEGNMSVRESADIQAVNDVLYVVGDDGQTGEELYRIDVDYRIVEI